MDDRNEDGVPGADPDEDLQFDRAEYGDETATETQCASCGAVIDDAYFQVAGNVVCARCKASIEQAVTGGSGGLRFARASAFGFVAAVLGALLYYGVRELTDREFAIVSIVIGLMVGGAVRAGARRRGGWVYQTLAVVLTYLAIGSTYVPLALSEFDEMDETAAATEASGVLSKSDAPTDAAEAPTEDPEAMPAAADDSELEADAEAEPGAPLPAAAAEADGFTLPDPAEASPWLVLAIAVAGLLAFSLALPVLVGIQSPIMLLIVAIGLFEAWRMNRRVPLEITGPHAVVPPSAAPHG